MTLTTMMVLIALLAIVLACAWLSNPKARNPKSKIQNRKFGTVHFANVETNVGTHEGSVSRKGDAVIATRHLLAKVGTDIAHVNLCGAADRPLGVMDDEVKAIEDDVNVNLLGIYKRTIKMIASEAIAADVDVYTAANGKIQDEPAAAGTFWKVGRSMNAAAADGDPVEVQHCEPEKVVVIVALGNANNEIGALAIGAAYSQAEVTALRDKTEELADDVRAIAAALATPAAVKVLV